jgi:pSer/pThr/pTyr-binding forkhead associated (FHA) protein
MLTVCSACTHENRPASFFCSQCGTKLHFAAAPTSGRLVRMNGPQQERAIELVDPIAILGRGPTASIRLEDESVSKHHARLSVEQGVYHLEDLESSNGTFLNGKRVRERTELRPGDLVRLGAVILKLEV